MPKRNRRREERKFGGAKDYAPPPIKLAEVTNADKQRLGGLVLWTHTYVNYIYANGGHDGGRLPKLVSESIFWSISRLNPRYSFDAHSSARNQLSYLMDDYERQREQGLSLVTSEEYKNDPEAYRSDSENLRIEIDADGEIAGGRYYWLGADEARRPAPDATFYSLEEAHSATVSARAAYLLGKFRNLVLDPPSDMELRNIWDNTLSIAPPEEFHALPVFPAE